MSADREPSPSGPPSPPPPAPTLPADRTGRHALISGVWRPQEEDTSPRATDFRARRGERIAVELRDAWGKPSYTKTDGRKVEATGIWAWLEPLRDDVGELVAESRAAKARKKGVAGWLGARVDKLVDTFLPAALVLAAALVARHFHW